MLLYLLLVAILSGPRPEAASRPARLHTATTLAARIGPPPLTRGRRCIHVSVQRHAIDAMASRAPTIGGGAR